jgi:anti-sigma B factor antagonist
MSTPPVYAVEIDSGVDPVVVRVRGELDLSAAPSLLQKLDEAAPASASVVVDLSAVEFLDSSAIGALLRAGRARSAAGGRLQIGPRSAAVDRLLEITGLSDSSEAFELLPRPT